MKAGWKIERLDAVCDLITCGVAARPKYVAVGVPFLSAKNVKDGNIIWSGYNCVSKKTHDELTKNNKPIKGDILYTRVGSFGEAAVIEEETEFSVFVSLTLIKPKKHLLNNYFLKYYLNSSEVKELAKRSINSSGVGNLNVGTVREFPIHFPTLPDQHHIVGILDEAFDGITIAIANAKKNLQNARALFASHLQSVFTQRGEGWVETTLGVAYDVRDGTHDSPKYHATGYPLITSKNLKREGLSFDDINLISEKDYQKINERSAVHKGDVLFAMIGTIGNPTLVEVEPNFAIKNVALFKMRHGQSGTFLMYYLGSSTVITKMMNEAKGTTQKFVGLGYLRSFPINLPPLAEQVVIVKKLAELEKETLRLESIYQQKLTSLEALKKSLLHQAFNGDL